MHGPAGALAATCRRLRWRSTDGKIFRDDVGATLDATLDPPHAFAAAAKRSIDRLCRDQVVTELPFANPHTADISHHSPFAADNERDGGRRHVLVDLVPFLRPSYKSSKKIADRFPQWTPKCNGYLSSAINGGQWPQVRKAKLPNFTGSVHCQLCHTETGTLLHRQSCPATRPAEGWTPLDQQALSFLDGLSQDRAMLATTRGVLIVKIPVAQPQISTKGWRWLSAPPDPNADNLTWVIDGSRRYASDWTLATTGCGVAVITTDGTLVAYATATPPPWVKTAGSAEAWVLLLTLKENPTPPRVLTDCLGILKTANAGAYEATRGKKADARIWKSISDLTGGSLCLLAKSLIWMPAHTSAAAACTRAKSDGRQLTAPEWRANDLADKLAKRGALLSPLRDDADAKIKAAGGALQQLAARLGTVTLAANNRRTDYIKADGTPAFRMDRDSSAMPSALAREKRSAKEEVQPACPSTATTTGPSASARPLVEATVRQKKLAARKAHGATANASQAAALSQLLGEATARNQPQAVSAAERMAALRARLGLTTSASNDPPSEPQRHHSLVEATSSLGTPAAALPEEETWTFLGERSL